MSAPLAFGQLDLSHIEIVFVNGCNSAVRQEGSATLTDGLIQGGVRNYVGFSLPVETTRAEFIAARFWKLVLDGQPVHTAVAAAPRSKKFGLHSLEWASLQHFGTIEKPTQHSRWKQAFITAALVAVLGAALGSWLMLRDAESAQRQDPASMPSTHALQSHLATEHAPRRQAAPGQTQPAKPAAPEVARNGPDLKDTENPELRGLIAEFRRLPHPYYSERQKENVLRSILAAPLDDSIKIARLRSEFP